MRGQDSSGIAAHFSLDHPGVDQRQAVNYISMRVMATRSKNMQRGLLEAIYIEEAEMDPSLTTANRKGEWGRSTLRRLATQASQ